MPLRPPPFRSIVLALAVAPALALALAAAPAAAEIHPPRVAQIHSGHSLTDGAMFKGGWPGHGVALIERLGGRLWLESEQGRGSRFSFTVPATPAKEEELKPEEESEDSSKGEEEQPK